MCIVSKNIPAKFHPGPIWNEGALGFIFEERRPNNNNEMSSDMGSFPDPKNDRVGFMNRFVLSAESGDFCVDANMSHRCG